MATDGTRDDDERERNFDDAWAHIVANYGAAYGSLGGVVVLLLFLFLSAAALPVRSLSTSVPSG